MIPIMHSKQPHEVIGFSIMVYIFTLSTAPADALQTYSSTPLKRPNLASMTSPFMIGWFPPVGSISFAALQSSQLNAPQRPSLSGDTTQRWLGANDWQRRHE